ncbi:six-hairpin glycosidase [Lucifera butyrica]|uniref:Six-hairpin glycosidase n=1 Tax=Lucifera butyrica TaxID=1351585 RepID=A0A498R2X7_9FIRM|nr:beta-L-arabinofuranosidase domain-containing protein [Lucifera butyrica]VBB05741.1 six-hairpin glycosidase [Lucifera butyrica]
MNRNTHKPILLQNVRIHDRFWSRRIKLIAEEVIPYQWEALNDTIDGAEPSHAIENFRIAAGEIRGDFYGMVFQDSDVAKWMEAASYSLVTYPSSKLEAIMDEVVELIGKAQQEDGYLNTYFIAANPGERWTDLSFGHELYCAGHLIEAAVAYNSATGKRKFLDIMCRYVDYIDSVMGPEEGKRKIYCGHEEIELALVRLYKATGEEQYLRLSQYFVDERGKQPCFLQNEPTFGNIYKDKWFDLAYHQAHMPVREQTTAEGHSVRAMYLYSAMADLARETGDDSFLAALDKLWDNTTTRKMYITGGLGSQGHAERFTVDYDLPNDRAYTETCAAIGLIFWAQRMLLLNPDRRYADVLERSLYNGALSGISMDGKRYFYVNPLEVIPEVAMNRYDCEHVKTERQEWFGCACCPPNIARLVASLGQYIYSQQESAIYTHLYISSNAQFDIDGKTVMIKQSSNYPWDGTISISLTVAEKQKFTLALRVPGWCRQYQLAVNGEKMDFLTIEDGYAVLSREWIDNDEITLTLAMPVEIVHAHPRVRENIGKVAIQRGPLIYCLEEADNGKGLAEVMLETNAGLAAKFDEDLFDGTVVITGNAKWYGGGIGEKHLYQFGEYPAKHKAIKAIPYYLWGNRQPGNEMLVWVSKAFRPI